MREELLEILGEIRPDVDFEAAKGLVTDSVLDSFDIMSLVGELSDAFDIDIEPKEMLPKNFDSVDAIISLIERLQDE